MLIYSTTTDQSTYDPYAYTRPPAWEDYDAHQGCVHSIGFCADAEWD